MLISSAMNLGQLAERMGGDCSNDDAAKLRPLLVAEFDGQDTRDVPEQRWQQLMVDACGE